VEVLWTDVSVHCLLVNRCPRIGLGLYWETTKICVNGRFIDRGLDPKFSKYGAGA
jgi:hypothetical protein